MPIGCGWYRFSRSCRLTTSMTQYCRVAPIGRIAQAEHLGEVRIHRAAPGRLVGDLPEHVWQIVQHIDHFADVRFFERLHAGVERQHLVIDDRGNADTVDVVGGVEGMAFDVVGRGREVQRPAVEQHDGDIDAFVAGGDDALAQPVEERLVKLRQVELRFAVFGHARPGPRPRLRHHAEMVAAPGGLRLKLLPTPQPDEVVPVLFEERQIRGPVEPLRRLAAR